MKTKNTVFEIKFVDCHAFHEWLSIKEREGIVDYTEWKEPKYIEAVFTRYAMDENGYHVGYEQYYIRWKMFKKDELGIFGIPPSIFPYVVNPMYFDIRKIVGAVRNSSYYWKPDADFVHGEIENHLSRLYEEIEEALFHVDKEMRWWSCGDYEMPI